MWRRTKPLSYEERRRARKHILNCDSLFDGNSVEGANPRGHQDKEFAYQQLRLLTRELLDKLS